MSTTAISVEGFSKKYFKSKPLAVSGASFIVNEGEFHGFIGANGAGKTTTIKTIIGAYSKSHFEGKIKIYGFDNDSVEAKKLIGYVPEQALFPSYLSSLEYLRYTGFVSGLSWSNAKRVAKQKLEELGLLDFAKKSPNSMSSGQKRKLLLAQAMLTNPKILIMDEPTANLDPQSRNELLVHLKSLNNKGVTIFLSSHILSEIEQYASHVTILDKGKVISSTAIKQLTKNSDVVCYEIKLTSIEKIEKIKAMLNKNKVGIKVEKETIYFNLPKNNNVQFSDVIEFLSKNKIQFEFAGVAQKSLEESYLGVIKGDSNA